MIDDGDCGAIGGMKIGKGKPKYSEKTCPSATLSTKNTTWPDPGSNQGRHDGKPATNRLSYDTALKGIYPGIFQGIIPNLPWRDGGISQRNTEDRQDGSTYQLPSAYMPSLWKGCVYLPCRIMLSSNEALISWYCCTGDIPGAVIWYRGQKYKLFWLLCLSFNFNYDNFITNSVELSPSWEANSCSASQEMSSISWSHVHNSLPLSPILSQMNSVHKFPSSFLIFILILSSHLRTTCSAHLMILDTCHCFQWICLTEVLYAPRSK
jgi:hypothetical protein